MFSRSCRRLPVKKGDAKTRLPGGIFGRAHSRARSFLSRKKMAGGLPKQVSCRCSCLWNSVEDAHAKAQALALRVVADRLEEGEAGSDFLGISFNAAYQWPSTQA